MSDFSRRFGYEPPQVDLPEQEMPNSLRSALWDAFKMYFLNNISHFDRISGQERPTKAFKDLTTLLWFSFFRESLDEIPDEATRAVASLRYRFFEFPFNRVYEFIEFVARADLDDEWSDATARNFADFRNRVLKRERSAFRFANRTLVKISEPVALEEIQSATENSISGAVGQHIKRAAELYSQQSPDYRNSVKESISAVEAAVRYVTGRKTVGVDKPLRQISNIFPIHPALREGFEKLYAFSSDSEGVRHSLLEEATITQADARYMLVSCSAFANYLLALKAHARTG